MDEKHAVALSVGLQTLVLKRCPIHREVFYDDVDPSPAFALALHLMKSRIPCVDAFDNNAHELMDMISETIGAAPPACRACEAGSDWRNNASERRSTEVLTEL